MNSEQNQTREFFDKLIKSEMYTTGCWVMVGMMTVFLVMMFFLPVQELLVDVNESFPLLFLMVLCGPVAACFRIMPYQAYGTQPNHRMVAEIIKYHPINRAEKKKMELFYTVRYMAKVTLVGMIVQITMALLVYKSISWMNIAYVFVVAFVYPVLLNIFSIYFEK